MKSKSATLEDVARHAGVSYQTVSRVLNKSANVSEATRRKVEKSIEALRYVPNRLAQQLGGKERAVHTPTPYRKTGRVQATVTTSPAPSRWRRR